MKISLLENQLEIEGLKKRYSHIHPLVFHRSLERSKNIMDLFDILEKIPKTYPFSWCENERCWKKEKDVILFDSLERKK